MPETNARIKVCHDTAANFKTNNPTLLVGEWALETDTKKMKIGDGSTAYNALPYSTAEDSDEWQKPDDWIDIRSGALPNSVYFLVGHSEDYQTYPEFGVYVNLSGTNTTYDVYIDGIKHSTNNRQTAVTLNWQTLALTSGYDVTYPATLRTHIVRITPTDPTVTITNIRQRVSTSSTFGTLWVHFTISNRANLQFLIAGASSGTIITSPVLEAITTNQESLKATGSMEGFCRNCPSLKTVPVLDMEGATNIKNLFASCSSLKLVKIKNYNGTGQTSENAFNGASALKKVESENSIISLGYRTFRNCSNLTSIENAIFDYTSTNSIREFFAGCSSLEPISLDLSNASTITRFIVGGTDTTPVLGIKGVVASSSAPFDSETSPQLDVSYTGLNRAALVNLFNSMPYNIGYTVEGSPTISNGVVSGFSSNNYLSLPNYTATDITIPRSSKIKFTTSDTIGEMGLMGNSTNYSVNGFRTDSYSKLAARIRVTGSPILADANISATCDYVLQPNTTYIAEYVFENYSIKAFLYDANKTLLSSAEEQIDNSYTKTASFAGFRIGRTQNGVFNGSIDLNETYIKLNGIPFFTGAAAMTKTCSVVGCTGTAALTGDDKNIALNKGWELTVA